MEYGGRLASWRRAFGGTPVVPGVLVVGGGTGGSFGPRRRIPLLLGSTTTCGSVEGGGVELRARGEGVVVRRLPRPRPLPLRPRPPLPSGCIVEGGGVGTTSQKDLGCAMASPPALGATTRPFEEDATISVSWGWTWADTTAYATDRGK